MITKKPFGTMPDGTPVEEYSIRNSHGMTVKVLSLGATLTSILVPDRSGGTKDVLLGYDTLEGYLTGGNHVGGTVGRFANRIAGGKFTLDGKTYQVTVNDGKNSLHGGSGIDFKVWTVEQDGDTALRMTYVSPDGEDGYPGTMTIRLRLSVDEENGMHLDYEAETDQATICNLTNHAYFNFTQLEHDVLDHELWLNADVYTKTNDEILPVADLPVDGTEYDFRKARPLGKAIYDNNFTLKGGAGPQASVYEKTTGICMEVFTDRPCLQIYDSVMLPDQADKGGRRHGRGSGLCLETQLAPNCPNRPGFTGFVLRPGETCKTSTVYRFSVK